MNLELLKKIAYKAYVVAYAANLNFATYKMAKVLPGFIAFLSIVSGILGLACSVFTSATMSVIILILGVLSIYIERFTHDIDSYALRGKKNIDQRNRLRSLYDEVKLGGETLDYKHIEEKYRQIESEFNEDSQPNQMLFANWLAHFTLFAESDVSWMDETLHFGFWKDKIPQTAKVFLYFLLLAILVYYCIVAPWLNEFIKEILFID